MDLSCLHYIDVNMYLIYCILAESDDSYAVNIESIFPLIEVTGKRNLNCSHFLSPSFIVVELAQCCHLAWFAVKILPPLHETV